MASLLQQKGSAIDGSKHGFQHPFIFEHLTNSGNQTLPAAGPESFLPKTAPQTGCRALAELAYPLDGA
jgi:hypothetical protein